MNLFEEELNQVFKVAETEKELNNFFDHIAMSSLFTKPPFLYVLKCRLAVDPEMENEIRDAWKTFREGDVK
ncbi:hypothetical protein [Listeria seeligeri]|uniref:hypothetical protein n=1 Tax=Listeria seeligeri TaxID=1640 RepID=UPI001889080E|nr:hypothetical protein [Listeria seeligeri]MBF2653944.1 hypothetical protein [Listeria seeligeri]